MLRPPPRRALSRYSRCGARVSPGVPVHGAGSGTAEGRSKSAKFSGSDTARSARARDGLAAGDGDAVKKDRKPSLIEQLFPEEARRNEAAHRAAERDIPRLPLHDLPPMPLSRRFVPKIPTDGYGADIDPAALTKFAEMRRQDEANSEVTVLEFQNASLNLTEDDFRRLIPQGRHLEGWKLDQLDIIKVIPARNMATLEQENCYYLLFSSRIAAFTYIGQVIRMFKTVQTQTPSSVTSPIPPPPGYMIDGMDAHAVIETFALIPPSQTLRLRQLKPPLTPVMASLVRHQGYASLVNRPAKSPAECRLTFDGPQLQASLIRHIILKTGKNIGVTWSGGDAPVPKITKWDPPIWQPSPENAGSQRVLDWERKQARMEMMDAEEIAEMARRKAEKQNARLGGFGAPRMSNRLVYILGFETAAAAQRFMVFWHRREMAVKENDKGRKGREDHDEEDAPAIANVELLW